jgi:N-acetylneuraminic acid mutarotase
MPASTPTTSGRAAVLLGLALVLALVGACGGEGVTPPTGAGTPPGGSGQPSAPGRWSARAAMPTPRQEMPAVAIGDRVYVPGGIGAGGHLVAAMEVYVPATDRWESAPPLPVALHHHAGVALDGRLYVVGGYTSLHGGPWLGSAQVHVYDPAQRAWSTAAPMPGARGAMAAAVLGGRLYVFGGSTGVQTLGTAAVYDPGTDRWSVLPGMPGGVREHMHAATVGDRIYVVAGRPSNSGPVPNERRVEVFVPATGQWTTGPDLLVARSGHAVELLGDRVMAIGGEAPSGPIASAEGLVLATGQWSMHAAPPGGARTAMGSAVVDGMLYLFGGAGPGLAAGSTLALTVP